ncbi:MAG: winged helix-turn-helix domain-containing protein [Nitrososphaerota archaeon]
MYNLNTLSLNYEIDEESFTGIIITQCILIKQMKEDESFTKVCIFKDGFAYYSNIELIKIMEIKVEESIAFHNYKLRSKNELKHNNFPFKDFYWLSTINHKSFRKRKRSKLEISAEIIEYLQSDFLDLNEIAFYSGLNYKTAKKYIEFLLMNELIDSIVIKGKIYYKASSKGIQFIKYFKEINKLFNYKNN